MYEQLLDTIKYSFYNRELLKTALTHSSYIHEHKSSFKSDQAQESNERLEFLGDAVLELVISEYLFTSFPDMPEGELTKYRASIVCAQSLGKNAYKINLGKYLQLGRGEEQTGGRNRESLLADAFEALIGAIFMDSGFENAKKFILTQLHEDICRLENDFVLSDCKTYLQELIQKNSKEPLIYTIIAEKGPEHNKIFIAQVSHLNKNLGSGEGKSKKEAEQEAARQSLLNLQKSHK